MPSNEPKKKRQFQKIKKVQYWGKKLEDSLEGESSFLGGL